MQNVLRHISWEIKISPKFHNLLILLFISVNHATTLAFSVLERKAINVKYVNQICIFYRILLNNISIIKKLVVVSSNVLTLINIKMKLILDVKIDVLQIYLQMMKLINVLQVVLINLLIKDPVLSLVQIDLFNQGNILIFLFMLIQACLCILLLLM